MNKAELITSMSRKAAISKKDAENALLALIAEIEEAVKSNTKAEIAGFGIFETRTRMVRECKNGKEDFSACKIPIFKPDEHFENLLK